MRHALTLWNGLEVHRDASYSRLMFLIDLFFRHSHVILGFMIIIYDTDTHIYIIKDKDTLIQ